MWSRAGRQPSRAVGLLAALAVGAVSAAAQSPRAAPAPELRVDVVSGRRSAAHLGIGATITAGTYVRPGLIAAAGAGSHGASGRVDGFIRFHLDPFRESRWGAYGGGGISARFDAGEKPRSYLLVFIGLDGPAGSGVSPAFELGLGGGLRAGVSLRRALPERR